MVEEGKDAWAIARVARNPFGLKERGGNIKGEEGERILKDRELKEAFVRHNLKTEPRELGEVKDVGIAPTEDHVGVMIRRVREAI